MSLIEVGIQLELNLDINTLRPFGDVWVSCGMKSDIGVKARKFTSRKDSVCLKNIGEVGLAIHI